MLHLKRWQYAVDSLLVLRTIEACSCNKAWRLVSCKVHRHLEYNSRRDPSLGKIASFVALLEAILGTRHSRKLMFLLGKSTHARIRDVFARTMSTTIVLRSTPEFVFPILLCWGMTTQGNLFISASPSVDSLLPMPLPKPLSLPWYRCCGYLVSLLWTHAASLCPIQIQKRLNIYLASS